MGGAIGHEWHRYKTIFIPSKSNFPSVVCHLPPKSFMLLGMPSLLKADESPRAHLMFVSELYDVYELENHVNHKL